MNMLPDTDSDFGAEYDSEETLPLHFYLFILQLILKIEFFLGFFCINSLSFASFPFFFLLKLLRQKKKTPQKPLRVKPRCKVKALPLTDAGDSPYRDASVLRQKYTRC